LHTDITSRKAVPCTQVFKTEIVRNATTDHTTHYCTEGRKKPQPQREAGNNYIPIKNKNLHSYKKYYKIKVG
jgi:hypothetical protein